MTTQRLTPTRRTSGARWTPTLFTVFALMLATLAPTPTRAAPASGTVVAWGHNGYGETNVPAGLTGVTAIAAGIYHTVVLTQDGTVVAWGYNGYGQTDVPAGLTGVTAIAGGGYHTLALTQDGTVVAWGRNDYGQTNVPAGLTGVTAIAAGYTHTVALTQDGTVVAWGYNGFGETNVPAGLTGVTAIAAGGYHTLALKADGTIVAWGNNAYGQTNVPAGLTGVTAIAAGFGHTVALTQDGTVVAWGHNGYGQTRVPAGLTGVTAIAAGHIHTVALTRGGTVVAWGHNGFGETNVPAGLTGVTAIAARGYHTVALVPASTDTTPPTLGACPAAGPFLLNSGPQPVGPIAASDEAGGSGLDAAASTLTGTVDTSTVGAQRVTFTAVDQAGNQATQECSYRVSYQFAGLLAPIDTTAPNAAKAGQIIPVKWRLIDANGQPISDPASFVSVTSSATSSACSGTPDAVEEYAGSSGLAYLGDGYWQYNWKTPRSYAGQCRTMSLDLQDGSAYTAAFIFK